MIRIWHDNSGRDKYGSWFLSAVIIVDIQTGERTEFILNRWLANEKEDGNVSKLFIILCFYVCIVTENESHTPSK